MAGVLPAWPKVVVEKDDGGAPDRGGGSARLVVQLQPGQNICAARAPVLFSSTLTGVPLPGGGIRWESPGLGRLCFGFDIADVAQLDVRDAPYLVSADLVILWAGDVRFEPVSLPGVPGFTVASGWGAVWLLVPGTQIYASWGSVAGRGAPDLSPVVVDPAMLAWVRLAAGADGSPPVSLEPVQGPGDRVWVRLSGELSDACLHTAPHPCALRRSTSCGRCSG